MDSAALNAITDVDVLRAMVAEKIAHIAQREHTIHYKDAMIAKLTAEIARLRRVQFTAKSERMDPAQRELFDEAMAADIAAVESELEALRDTSPTTTPPVVAPTRKTPRRRTLPADLPRIQTIHEPASCDCDHCGQALVKIGEHVSEKLDCKPIEFFVRQDIYPQYACRPCERIVAEPVAPSILDRSIAAPGLLAQVVIQKYTDHLPLYRQEAIFARSGIVLSRTTLAEWIGVVGLRLQPLVDALRARLLTEPILHADETPVAQLDPGAGKTKRAYLFAYRSATATPIVVFDYCPSRAGQHAKDFLGDYAGALMVDDYAGYKALFEHGVTELGCWAHARRTFHEAHQASRSPIAEEALQRIGALYAIEAKVRDLDDATRTQIRQAHAGPVLSELKGWLDDLAPKVLGSTGLHKAVHYTLRRWTALTRYVHDGRLPIDNNPVENAIRPVAIGRKNWLFAGSETAGKRAAAIMSLLATAKAGYSAHEKPVFRTHGKPRFRTMGGHDSGPWEASDGCRLSVVVGV